MKKYAITIVVIIGVVFILFGSYYIYSTNHSDDDMSTLKSKADQEITYLNSTIIAMMNQLNHITYANYEVIEERKSLEGKSQDGGSSESQQQQNSNQTGESGGDQAQSQNSDSNTITSMNIEYNGILANTSKTIEWDSIKKEVEQMYGTWPTVLIDLNELSVNKDNLLRYNLVLENITQAVEKEDKKTSLKELANLYSLLASYLEEYSDNSKMVHIYNVKSDILYAYTLAEEDKWEEMKLSIKNAQSDFSNLMNQQLNDINNMSNINKTYVLLNETEKCIDKKDKNIFYINYKNLMQELEIIEG